LISFLNDSGRLSDERIQRIRTLRVFNTASRVPGARSVIGLRPFAQTMIGWREHDTFSGQAASQRRG